MDLGVSGEQFRRAAQFRNRLFEPCLPAQHGAQVTVRVAEGWTQFDSPAKRRFSRTQVAGMERETPQCGMVDRVSIAKVDGHP